MPGRNNLNPNWGAAPLHNGINSKVLSTSESARGHGADARLPTAREAELGRPLGAQELQQVGVDFLCMRPRDAVRTTLDDYEARA